MIDALVPDRATRAAMAAGPVPDRPPALLALGKAATGMARGAIAWLADHRCEPAGGLVVTHDDAAPPHATLQLAVGDHPVPGARSVAAAELLASVIAGLPPDVPVEVLLSGGTSSLIAAPVGGVSVDELATAFALFHEMGLPIHAMNALRRQLTRWSGGQLARALSPRPVRAWVISDVVGNDLGTIASGPLVAERIDPSVIATIVREWRLATRLPRSVIDALGATAIEPTATVSHHLVADRHAAARMAAAAIRADGAQVIVHTRPLDGDATEAAIAIVRRLWRNSRQRSFIEMAAQGILADPSPPRLVVHLWTGETTVALPVPHGRGGRAQQFALAAARELHRIAQTLEGGEVALTVLAAGTDGRDGPTDAAGAIIDGGSWRKMLAAGLDPGAALATADAYTVLEAAGALLRTGVTGTNVGDVVMAASWE
jgi:hydroxypyruvate reductase